jgi:REP element-mobilizing transposase RayT
MARPYRLQAADCFYHITSRGNGRKAIYINEKDREKFLEYISTAKEKFKFYLHAYCLMTNHYHLFLETTQPNLSRIMQYINTAYTIYYNTKRNKSGHLFQGRYKSILVEQDSYFTELTRYIHINPVIAKITTSPALYRWSSYNAYIRGKDDGLVDIGRVKQFLGMDLKRYRTFVEAVKDYPDPFKNVYAGFMLGGVKFIKDKLKLLQTDIESKDFAHKRAVKDIIEPETIINTVADYFKITPDELLCLKKRPLTAKHTAIYLLRKKTGLTNARIGSLFGMKHSTVSMAALGFGKKIELDKKLKSAVDRISWKFEV